MRANSIYYRRVTPIAVFGYRGRGAVRGLRILKLIAAYLLCQGTPVGSKASQQVPPHPLNVQDSSGSLKESPAKPALLSPTALRDLAVFGEMGRIAIFDFLDQLIYLSVNLACLLND